MTVGGIFYFDEKFEYGTYEYTTNSPNFVVGNPAASWRKDSRDELTICFSVKEVILAFQIGIDFPVMIPNMDYFPHYVFTPFKRITVMRSDMGLLDRLGRDYAASYQLERELEPEDTLEDLSQNKRWYRLGIEHTVIRQNPFNYLDQLWWHTITPASQRHYLWSSNGEIYDLNKKLYRKDMYYIADTEYGPIHVNSDAAVSSIPDDLEHPPSTEEIFELVRTALMGQLPFMREEYCRALAYWIMYAYCFPIFPFPPQNLTLCIENVSHKQAINFVLTKYLMPSSREGYHVFTMPSAQLLLIDRQSTPHETGLVPRCFITTLRDRWFDIPPAMIIGKIT